MCASSESAPSRIIAFAISREVKAALALGHPGVDLERAQLAEPELRADRRGRVAIGLDDGSLAAVASRVGEPAFHERAVDALAARLGYGRCATEEDERRLG